MSSKIALNGVWRLYIKENCNCSGFAENITSERKLLQHGIKCIDGSVPGNFELDMQKAGLIEEPFFGTNALKLQRLENRHLWYCREFMYTENDTENVYIKFDGIDTFADVYINGVLIGSSDNMLIPFEFKAENINVGKNEILVHIKPTCIEARKYSFDFEVNTCQKYNYASLMTRKAAHSFGWDIFPRIVSGGIWREVSILKKKSDSIKEFFIDTVSCNKESAVLSGYYELGFSGDFVQDYSLKITGKCGNSSFSIAEEKLWHSQSHFSVTVENPVLWWPRFMGEPSLYNVSITLLKNGLIVDEKEIHFGVRKIKLSKTDIIDENGNGEFLFEVNGKPMYIMGTNWVPLDAFHSRDTERLKQAFDLLLEENCNAVRCWGGNVYESDEFFELCDKYGIIVWQDFAMGCASYPQNDNLCDRIRIEVESVVKRLRQHPSLALWAGDNECDIATAYWNADKRDPTHNRITRKVIPEVLKRLNPFREYLPSSPYVSEKAYSANKENILPEDHLWGPRDYFKGDYYVNSTARFASEMGYHGAPGVESIKKFISEDMLWPISNDEWQVHSSCMELGADVTYSYRNKLMSDQIKVLFGETPDSLDDFVLASQISQAEAMKFFVERFRSAKWKRTGLIWWNLIDGWPQFSDAVVDYYFNQKLAFDFIKRSQQPLALMFREPENGKIELIAANELPHKINFNYKVTDMESGEILSDGTAYADGFSVNILDTVICNTEKTKYYFIEWQSDMFSGVNHYLCGKAPYDIEEYINLMTKYRLLNMEQVNK